MIDTVLDGSVSFAPPDPSDVRALEMARSGRSTGTVDGGRRVSTPASLGGASRDGVSGYPIQIGKVQRPPLREETLARHRLLDWLDVKIHNRVVFVIADAGYGKTTLLADFSRRTRLRTLWYRMDEEDRNWVTFLSYLVAAGREHEAEFAPRTHAMLQDTGPGGASRDEAVAMFLRELPDIAPTPTVLILDDYHVADGSGDVAYVAKSLITRAPERLTIVISSRRTPEVAVGRLRAQGELAELRTRDLQFSEREIADLFESKDGRHLDPESLDLLNRRSEGWAASLQLVHAAVRDRTLTEARDFIRGLSGGQDELYDYLAEEVVGDLRHGHQEFLMRTSILQVVTAQGAAVLADLPSLESASLLELSEHLGLISRRSSASGAYRYHPLVREFLEARLKASVGEAGVRELHQAAGDWARDSDWRAACHHFEAASNIGALHEVIDTSIDTISGQAGYETAADYLRRHKPAVTTASFEIISSRMDHRNGRNESAVHRARQALALRPESDAVINNAITMYANVGDHDASWALAKRLAASSTSDLFRGIAKANCLRYEASLDGSLQDLIDVLMDLGELSEANALPHFAGVSYLNLSLVEQAKGDTAAALEHAELAVQELLQTHQSDELASAYLARAVAAARAGRLESARDDVGAARDVVSTTWRAEWLLEAADIEVAYGSADTAESLLDEARATAMLHTLRNYAITIEARLALRTGKLDLALDRANAFEVGSPSEVPGFMSRQLAIQGHVAVVGGLEGADELLSKGLELAEKQGAVPWVRYLRVLKAAQTPEPGRSVETLLRRISDDEMSTLDPFAELISGHLSTFDEATVERFAINASRRRERWLPAMRAEISDPNSPSRWRAGEILDRFGTAEDVPLLRALARTTRGTAPRSLLGRTLARRLAPRVTVEDLGRIEVLYGGSVMAATSIRRKVLAMLTFLLTRPGFAATRDEVIDALWPELAPDVAMNSLNQTVYFLRRVFEPTYQEDLSAGYVHHTSDVLWLDQELVTSRSAECFSLIDAIGSDLDPTLVARLSEAYEERFALDFTYEDWAVPFRTALQTAYLQIIEAAVTQDMASGHQDRAIDLARRALERDPAVESLEVALLRLYRATGAHAAAAEQYAHYASVLKDELGVEAPPLSSL